MKVKLSKMTIQEFKMFYDHISNDYAKDIMKVQNVSLEDALCQAKAEFAEMAPSGLDSQDNAFMVIEDFYDGRGVGVIWYLYEMSDGVKQVFLSEFSVKEDERRKGYASAALKEMEQEAKACGCEQSILYVAQVNIPAINLYTKCGYTALRPVANGMYMKKELC